MNGQTSIFSRNIRLRLVMLHAYCQGFSIDALTKAAGFTKANWRAYLRSDGRHKTETIKRVSWLLAMPDQLLQYGLPAEVVCADIPADASWLRKYDEDNADWLQFRHRNKRLQMMKAPTRDIDHCASI